MLMRALSLASGQHSAQHAWTLSELRAERRCLFTIANGGYDVELRTQSQHFYMRLRGRIKLYIVHGEMHPLSGFINN